MEYNYIKIGERIRNERKKLGVSQEKLLDNIRDKGKPTFGRNTLSSLENGDKDAFQAVNVAQFMALCEEFDCSIGYLLGEYEAHNYDNEFICKNTGLWEENVKYLETVPEISIYVNALISDNSHFPLCLDFLSILCDGELYRSDEDLLKRIDKTFGTLLDSSGYDQIRDIYKQVKKRHRDYEDMINVKLYKMGIAWGSFTKAISEGTSLTYDLILNDFLSKDAVHSKLYKERKSANEAIARSIFGEDIDNENPTGL